MRKMQKIRLAAVVVSIVLLLGGTLSGTLAWMLARTSPVTNTFTTSNIAITLAETGMDDNRTKEYKMIPGVVRDKDPVVTVLENSEDCWVFIKIEKSNSLDDYISYAIDENNWEKLLDDNQQWVDGVYCTKVPVQDVNKDRSIKILGGGEAEFTLSEDQSKETYSWGSQQVLIRPDVTEKMMDAVKDKTVEMPTLTFTAYASQYIKNSTENFSQYDAWLNLPKNSTGSNT